ncbi:hypothetical protein FRC09_001831 [Ceratobasidium sp. 395]|nr:hypothetical protein FRC09_001831 [Ceratobasidium sp. 395]
MVDKQPPPAQQPEVRVDTDVDPPEEHKAQAQAQAPVASTHPNPAGHSAGPDTGTATQPTLLDDKNAPPPIKPLRKHKLPITALSLPASNANFEAKSENALPPRETMTLWLSYPNKPRPIHSASNLCRSTSQPCLPVSQPHPPTSQPSLPTSQQCPPTSQQRPPTSQSSPPASQPVHTSQPSEVTEEVPETDPKILAERVPRYWPATYSGTCLHIGSLYPLDPKKTPLDYASWRQSVHARPPLNLPSPSNPSSQPVAPTLNLPQSDQTKRKVTLATKQDAAKAMLNETINPSDPVTDVQCNMICDGHCCLKAMASTIVGCKERKKKLLPACSCASGSSRHTGIDSWAHRGDDNNNDEEAEDQGIDNNDENEDKNTKHQERILLMVNNLASLRCNAKIVGRALLKPVFGLLRPAMTRANIDHNLDILQHIYLLQFHCTDPQARTGHYEGLIIPHAIAAILFYGESSVVVSIKAGINFCLSEWMVPGSKGIRMAQKLSQVSQGGMQNMWLSHMENIRWFQAGTGACLNRLSTDWFKYALSSLNPRKRHCNPPSNSQSQANSKARPSSHRTCLGNEPTGDHKVAMSWQRAEYEAVGVEMDGEAGEAEYVPASQGGPLDLDSQPQAQCTPSYEFSGPTPTPPQVDDEGQYTLASKGKGWS